MHSDRDSACTSSMWNREFLHCLHLGLVALPPLLLQLTPAEAAKLKAAESRQLNKAAKAAKEAAGMRKLSGFFKPRAGTNQSA